MTTSPEWDDEVVPQEEEVGPGLFGGSLPPNQEYWTTTNAPASGSYAYFDSLNSTGEPITWGTVVSQDLTISTSRMIFRPTEANSGRPTIEYDLSAASWKLTLIVALNILLGPFLCVLSKILKKPVGIQ